MSLKYPHSDIDFLVTPAYFLGGFDVHDREESLGERLNGFDPNQPEQLRAVMEEYFFSRRRAKDLTGKHKAELVRHLELALSDGDFDFDALVNHERIDPADCFSLPFAWSIHRPDEFFRNILGFALEFWRDDLAAAGYRPVS